MITNLLIIIMLIGIFASVFAARSWPRCAEVKKAAYAHTYENSGLMFCFGDSLRAAQEQSDLAKAERSFNKVHRRDFLRSFGAIAPNIYFNIHRYTPLSVARKVSYLSRKARLGIARLV